MDNKTNKIKIIILLIVTNIVTFILSNFIGLKINRSALIPREEYNSLRDNYYRYSKVIEVEKYIKENYLRDTDDNDLLDGQLKGLLASLNDPYSVYLTQEEFSKLLEDTSGSFGGVGVVVTPGDDGLITVVSSLEGTPGEKAGIKNGDKIIKVNGREFTGENMDEAVKAMKGEPGTDVRIDLIRGLGTAGQQEINLKLKREEIRVKTVSAQLIENDIGYISLSSFDEKTYIDFKKELDNFQSKNISGLVLDLRNNPGGLLDVAAEIANEFLTEGNIVYTQTKDGKREYIKSDNKHVEFPVVLVVNGGSASASEILAGAIKDRDRGKVVGTTTFGKGVVQRLQDLPDGSGLKLTISEYFTPSGINIHGIGIKPNVEVENPEGLQVIGPDNLKEDVQLKKAIEVLKSDINNN